MKQLRCAELGRIAWHEVATPTIDSPNAALIRPLAVARCDIDLVQITQFPHPEPYALGHECIGEVIEVGDAVNTIKPGQRVIVPYQVSCGSCRYCGLGLTASCSIEPGACMYGMRPLSLREFGGMLADQVHIPFADAMLVALPDGLDPCDVAAVADNATLGYSAVAEPLTRRAGAEVLVIGDGCPSVPLFAAQAARALGAERVDLMSRDRTLLDFAEKLGFHPIETDFQTRGGRYPVVVEAGTSVEVLKFALLSTDCGGVCVNTGPLVLPTQDASLPLGMMYARGVRLLSGAVHTRPRLPEVLELVKTGRLRPQDITSVRVGLDDVLDAYLEPAIKLVVDCQDGQLATPS